MLSNYLSAFALRIQFALIKSSEWQQIDIALEIDASELSTFSAMFKTHFPTSPRSHFALHHLNEFPASFCFRSYVYNMYFTLGIKMQQNCKVKKNT